MKAMSTLQLSVVVGLLILGGVLFGAEPRRVSCSQAILTMGDNTWLKLNPSREPRSRMYSGCCMGQGKLWFFGGGHGGYRYNDVELYDIACNEWTRLTEKETWQEVKGAEGMGGGWGVSVLSHKMRPLGQHTYQQVCWVPRRRKFFAVLSPGTWEFDPETGKWQCLAGLHAGKLVEKAGPLKPARFEKVKLGYKVTAWQTRDGRNVVKTKSGWQTTAGEPVTDIGTFSPSFVTGGGLVMYDGALKKPLCLAGGTAESRPVYAFDYGKMIWEKLMEVPIPKSVSNYSSFASDIGCHVIAVSSSGKTGWWLLDTARRKLKRIENIPEPLQESYTCQSLTYDSTNKVVLVLTRREVDSAGKRKIYELDVWAFDLLAGKFTKLLPASGPGPRSSGPLAKWATFWYDPACNVCIFLAQLGQGGYEGMPCQIWAYRYKQPRE